MPTYDYHCNKCKITKEIIRSISDDTEEKCQKCGTVMVRQFTLNRTGFIMKGGTPAINYREKQHRLKKREKLEKKEREKYGNGPKIRPNVAGMETNSWSDAQKLAKEAGMNHESYAPFVKKEKKKKIKVV